MGVETIALVKCGDMWETQPVVCRGGDIRVRVHKKGPYPVNLMVSWGEPKVVFCTHLDTVPPYIAPSVEVMEDGDMKIKGRGSCDAKGQIFAMWEACLELERRGCTDFALLLLAGEETGSFGAKAFSAMALRAVTTGDWVVNGASSDAATGPGVLHSEIRKGR